MASTRVVVPKSQLRGFQRGRRHATDQAMMIEITPTIALDEKEIELTFVRSSGPGGQNVNKLSTAVNFTISNTVATTQRILNPGFESGTASWTATSGVITSDATQAARTGSWKAWLNGYGAAHTDSVYQQV
eukprot:gene56834-75892_t